MSSTKNEVKNNYSRIFRRMFVKRKSATTGLFESTWQNISKDVEKWGKIRTDIDGIQYSKIKFNDIMPSMDNTSGRYNPNDDEFSLWFGYGSQQRSLIKIEAGFDSATQAASGIWTHTEYPTVTSVYFGIISGDIPLTGTNKVTLPIRPLLQIFRDFPARNLSGFTSTGLTASQFFAMIRDQTDGSSNYIFRPFFGDTSANWNIESTSQVYGELNTTTAKDVFDSSVWDIMEKLASAEDKTVYIKRDGTFNFTTRALTSTTQFQFHFFGPGSIDTEYGLTVKKINKFGKKYSDYYSRVQVKFDEADTITSYRTQESSFTVTGTNDPWNLGHRTFDFENLWIASTAAADNVLSTIFNQVTVVKDQIEFTSTFVSHLEILDKIRVSYDSGNQDVGSRWDLYDWADTSTDTSSDLIWSEAAGDAIRFINRDFKILGLELDLDRLETKVLAITV